MGIFKKMQIDKSSSDGLTMEAEIEEFSSKVKEFIQTHTLEGASEEKEALDKKSAALKKKWGIQSLTIEVGITVTVEKSIMTHKTKVLKAGEDDLEIFNEEKTKLQDSLNKALKSKIRNKKPN